MSANFSSRRFFPASLKLLLFLDAVLLLIGDLLLIGFLTGGGFLLTGDFAGLEKKQIVMLINL